MGNMEGAVAIAESRGDHADVFHRGAYGLIPTQTCLDFVANTKTVLQQHGQAREVVANTVLATDCDGRTKEAGTREKKCGVKVEHVEHRDDGDNPQHKTGELMQHARGGFDALSTTIFATFERLGTNATHRVLPPTFVATRFAVGNLAHDDSQNCVGDSCEDETPDDDDDRNDGSCQKSLDATDFLLGSKYDERGEQTSDVHLFSVADDWRSMTHPFISLSMMKTPRIVLIALTLVVLGACGDVEVVSNTSGEVAVTTTLEVSAVDEPSVATVVAPTTTIETTTTTMVPVATTVLDVACIKTTACQYANLVGVDFSRLKLDFIDFSVANLGGASFVGANLSNSIFIRADLSAVNFEGATLKNVDMTAAVLTAVSFKGANLEGAVLCDVDLTTVLDLTKAQLDQVKKFKTKGKVYCP